MSPERDFREAAADFFFEATFLADIGKSIHHGSPSSSPTLKGGQADWMTPALVSVHTPPRDESAIPRGAEILSWLARNPDVRLLFSPNSEDSRISFNVEQSELP